MERFLFNVTSKTIWGRLARQTTQPSRELHGMLLTGVEQLTSPQTATCTRPFGLSEKGALTVPVCL